MAPIQRRVKTPKLASLPAGKGNMNASLRSLFWYHDISPIGYQRLCRNAARGCLEAQWGSLTIVLHVGLIKTGTTFLQDRVFPAATGLTFVSRPYTQESPGFNTLQYADPSIYDPSLIAREIDAIRARSDGRPIVISDELLSGYPFYNYMNRALIAERLAAVLPDAQVAVVLRSQLDLLLSIYNQYVKIGWYHGPLNDDFLSAPGPGATLEGWFDGERRIEHSRRFIRNRGVCNVEHYRFSRLLDLYDRHFARVHVFLYEDFAASNAAVIDRLSEIVGTDLPSPRVDPARPANPRLDDRRLEQVRIANKLEVVGLRRRSLVSRVLARGAAALGRDRTGDSERHVRRLLGEVAMADDNRRVDEAWGLGMSRHAESYFGFV